MKIRARKFSGKIVAIKERAVNGILVLDIGGGQQISVNVSMESLRELGLKVGGKAYAVIKGSSVKVGVD